MSTLSILIMPEPRAPLRQELEQLGLTVFTASDDEWDHDVDLVLIQPKLLSASVAELRQSLEHSHPGVPVVVMGDAGLESAIAALRAGAADYLETTASALEVADAARRVALERAIANSLSGAARAPGQGLVLLGDSPPLCALRERLAGLAASNVPVSITGEPGSGKTLVARLLHGQHNQAPFLRIDCEAMFGSVDHRALFARVLNEVEVSTLRPRAQGAEHHASLCLREVTSLPLDAQAELLRSLSSRGVQSNGAPEHPAAFRLLTTSCVPLGDLLRCGKLTRELHDALAGAEIVVPPLRDRDHDVLTLAEALLRDVSLRLGKSVRSLSTAAAKALLSHGWPGNVRELEHVIEYAVTVTAVDHLSDSDLPETLQNRRHTAELEPGDARWSVVERQHIEAVLRSVAGNRARAARLLGIDRRTLHRKLDRLGIKVPARAQPVISK